METGWVENLYWIPGVTKETQQNVEKIFMGAVDTKAAQARDMMLGDVVPVQPELRHGWSRFLLSLMIRTPDEVKAFKYRVKQDMQTYNPEYQEKYDAIRREDWPATLEEWIQKSNPTMPERTAVLLLTKLIQNENVLRTFMRAEWWLLDTSSVQRKLLTSDHPLIMTNGLGRPDGHFAIPISPRKIFIAFVTQEFGRALRNLPTSRIVREINDAVIGQGRRSVYAFDEESTRVVKRRMGKRDYMVPLPFEMLKA